jgi:uncharacterized protein YybS (DUF2232 family)
MSNDHSFDNDQASRPEPSEEQKNQSLKSDADDLHANSDVVDEVGEDALSEIDEFSQVKVSAVSPVGEGNFPPQSPLQGDSPSPSKAPLAMVETAFLASAASLIWLINYYFPMGPLLRMFFPIPTALVYLRWGNRASWMGALVSGLLLSVLMGPTRSILFVIPYGLMGVQLGAMWKRRANWFFSISTGALLGTLGFFFRFWLFSLLLGEDLWIYVMTQITQFTEWGFARLGLLAQPSLILIEAIAVVAIILSNIVYLFVVHLVALLLLDRLGNPIPRPPNWVQILLDYEG